GFASGFLRTPPHGDAFAFGYGWRHHLREGLSPSKSVFMLGVQAEPRHLSLGFVVRTQVVDEPTPPEFSEIQEVKLANQLVGLVTA
ncbi:MAG: hypothetical protein ABSB61_13075, partial [Anaerolineales bacterium]